MLELQLRADWNACWVDNQLNNVFKRPGHEGSIRAQYEFYRYLQERYMKPGVENGDSTAPVV